ncbi:hypothetical protein E1B28_013197 [Marasmius oreades]|uniref:Cytochrome P450 n=1 Tax=Marasmius oreades TaxID=181124 RepID=A0A9P7RQ30_9AGAR|nr:uncharacterized protein E1B28_013197 [Marasmius oreades]KAG7087216.1 hypothetical protein E1B28_013197 [Marasmius oreades]
MTAAAFLQATTVAVVPSFLVIFGLLLRRNLRRRHFSVIPGPALASFFTGNILQFYGPDAAKFHQEIVQKYGSVVRLGGLLGESQLFISDEQGVRDILVKEDDIYEETSVFLIINRLIHGPSLLSTIGGIHSRQRRLMNPVFSTGNLRHLTPVFHKVTGELLSSLLLAVEHGPREIDIHDRLGRLSLQAIGEAGFGYNFNALSNDSSPYAKAVKEFFPLFTKMQIYLPLLPWLADIGPPWLRRFVAEKLPLPDLHDLLEMTDIMSSTSKRILDTRLAILDEKKIRDSEGAKDIFTILLKANINTQSKDHLSDEELMAQINMLVFAAMDTTSTALSRILYLLSTHTDAQETLRKELVEARGESDPGYEDIMALPFLDAICKETMRLYPPVTILTRTTREDTVLRLGKMIRLADGNSTDQIQIPRGTDVHVNLERVNTNPDLWGEDGHEWKPERWLSPLPTSVTGARIGGVYSHLLTFSGGRRACIGFKLAELEMKVVLFHLIPVLRFSPGSREILWRYGPLTTPSVAFDAKAQLPSVVEKI